MNRLIYCITLCCMCFSQLHAQRKIVLTLDDAVKIATDSAITAFINRNDYLKNKWQYEHDLALRKPQIAFRAGTQYNHKTYNISSSYYNAYNSNFFNTNIGLELQQKVFPLGGIFYANSSLVWQEFLGNSSPYGEFAPNRAFSSTPLLFGYRQQLIGYNPFKWEKLLIDLNFKQAAKQFLHTIQSIKAEATQKFFDLAGAEAILDIKQKNVDITQKMYEIGKRKFNIAAIRKDELLSLELQLLNAENALHNARLETEKAQFALLSFLKIDKRCNIAVQLPTIPKNILIDYQHAIQQAKDNSAELATLSINETTARRDLEQAKIESRFNLGVDISAGIDNFAGKLTTIYHHHNPYVYGGVTISIPLIDFGASKSKRRTAGYQLESITSSIQEANRLLEEQVFKSVQDFHSQQSLMQKAEEAVRIADTSFEQINRNYADGQTDINSFILAQSRKDEAYTNYINTLSNYWIQFQNICRLTLFDYLNNVSLLNEIDGIITSDSTKTLQ